MENDPLGSSPSDDFFIISSLPLNTKYQTQLQQKTIEEHLVLISSETCAQTQQALTSLP